ncbi:hypothetical protein KUM39_12995 [Streptomyces sp. J2-1]|uniref:DUF7683 domain-containing protein n=1 Tax=Streptomyces corallincola TaxID=2851888 RepID=UPI001C37EF58|nr:hypothetical protein [Streptomyces corallincola]MBV2355277.1 hypothetical protein [Streptomyces corallincola]
MKYVVASFNRETGQHEKDIDLKIDDAAELARIFDEPVERFVDMYPIDAARAASLHSAYGVEVDLTTFDNFLEVQAD